MYNNEKTYEKIFIKLADTDYSDKYDYSSNENVVERLIEYITNSKKTTYGHIGTANIYHLPPESFSATCARQFYATQILNGKFDLAGENKLIHLIVAFPYNDVLFGINNCISHANNIARFFAAEHQVVFALHTSSIQYNVKGPHIHFIINPISFVNGQYLRITTTHLMKVFEIIKSAYGENGYMIPRADYYIKINNSIYEHLNRQ